MSSGEKKISLVCMIKDFIGRYFGKKFITNVSVCEIKIVHMYYIILLIEARRRAKFTKYALGIALTLLKITIANDIYIYDNLYFFTHSNEKSYI